MRYWLVGMNQVSGFKENKTKLRDISEDFKKKKTVVKMITNIFILRIFLFFLYIPDLSTFHYFWKKWTYFQVKIFSTICFSSQYFVYLFYFHVSENEFNFLFFLIKKNSNLRWGSAVTLNFREAKGFYHRRLRGFRHADSNFNF